MSRLSKRIERLEHGAPSDEVLILGDYPNGVSEARCKEIAEAAAKERGFEPPFKVRMQQSGQPGGKTDILIWWIGTGAQLTAAFEEMWDRSSREEQIE